MRGKQKRNERETRNDKLFLRRAEVKEGNRGSEAVPAHAHVYGLRHLQSRSHDVLYVQCTLQVTLGLLNYFLYLLSTCSHHNEVLLL